MKKMVWFIVVCISFILVAVTSSFAEDKKADKETGNVVSKAAHQAQEEGLKGTELAGRVHEPIEERQETREQEKAEKHKMHKHGKKMTKPGFKGKGKGKK